jgi:hypothetical protein
LRAIAKLFAGHAFPTEELQSMQRLEPVQRLELTVQRLEPMQTDGPRVKI